MTNKEIAISIFEDFGKNRLAAMKCVDYMIGETHEESRKIELNDIKEKISKVRNKHGLKRDVILRLRKELASVENQYKVLSKGVSLKAKFQHQYVFYNDYNYLSFLDLIIQITEDKYNISLKELSCLFYLSELSLFKRSDIMDYMGRGEGGGRGIGGGFGDRSTDSFIGKMERLGWIKVEVNNHGRGRKAKKRYAFTGEFKSFMADFYKKVNKIERIRPNTTYLPERYVTKKALVWKVNAFNKSVRWHKKLREHMRGMMESLDNGNYKDNYPQRVIKIIKLDE